MQVEMDNKWETEGANSNSNLMRVLIVDDEENTRIGLSKLLSQEGYCIASAADGQEAIEYLQEEQWVDVVITDLKMPQLNGLQLLQELARNYPQIHVVMITAYGGVESYLEAINHGAFEYINKPVKLFELRSVLRKIEEQLALP